MPVEEEVAALADMGRKDLVARFEALYDRPPPKNFGMRFLRLAVAYRIQEKAYGGLSPPISRRLAKMAEELRATGEIGGSRPARPRPGTRLLREWNGETHSVTVTGDGYLYRGDNYRSLSGIARMITGTRWSGPAFFGLKEKQG